MPSASPTPVCLVAESARAAARAADRWDESTPQVILTNPHWRAALSVFSGGPLVVAIESGDQLSELLSLGHELERFQPVDLLIAEEIEVNLIADLISFYESCGLAIGSGDQAGKHLRLIRQTPPHEPTKTNVPALRTPTSLLSGWIGSIRVLFIGKEGPRLLGAQVSRLPSEDLTPKDIEDAARGWLNAVVIDDALNLEPSSYQPLIAEARRTGAPAVLISPGTRPSQLKPSDFDLHLSRCSATWVNPGEVRPFGFRRVVDGRLGVVGSLVDGRPGLDDGLALIGELAGSGGVDVFGDVRRVGLPDGVRVFAGGFDEGLVDRLRPYGGVVDHPGFHDSVEGRAEILVGLAAAGVPTVAVGVDEDLRALIGDELADVIGSAEIADLKDPEARDRLSVRLRRLGLSDGSQVTRWREIAGSLGLAVEPLPKVSVVMATNRPEYIEHALAQVKDQTYPTVELVLVLHGEEFTQTDRELEILFESPLTVIRVPTSVVFGEALNRGVAASTGSLIAKMDDDDWYSPHHLWDLVRAMDYSGADLVGKAAEFVYLEELDITIRRMVDGSETYGNRNLGGGTFLIKRTTLNTIGGWRRVPRHVDQKLLDDMEMLSYPWYRTFGHGYLLNRRSAGHTWDTSIDYFLEHSESQWRGLALDEALIANEPAS